MYSRIPKLRFFISSGAATLEQEGFRFRDDDGSESTASWRQLQDIDDTITSDTNFRLRMLLNATGDYATSQFQIEYKETSDSATEWRKISV